MKIQYRTSWHPFDFMKKKSQSHHWIQEVDAIVKSGGINDCFFKAKIKQDDSKNWYLKVYAMIIEPVVTIDLKTKSKKKALDLADNYLNSINTINYGTNDEFDLH